MLKELLDKLSSKAAETFTVEFGLTWSTIVMTVVGVAVLGTYLIWLNHKLSK